MPVKAQSKRTNTNSEGTIRYAVVGEGWISQAAVLPAFQHAKKNSQLTALVSGDPVKLKKLSKKYKIEHTYSYERYDECLRSGVVDAVYIALPNSMHRDYAVRAAEAGVHVLCEKPMARTEAECEEMIRACEDNDVKLMIAYRLHFEEANLRAVDIVKSGKIGAARIFDSVFTQQVEEGNIRLQKNLGGGTLDDMGVYCINAARYLFRAEPIEVFAVSARNEENRFAEVEEMTSAIMRFPDDRLATFVCSFGASGVSSYRVVGTKGDLMLNPAYDFVGERKHYLTIGDKKPRERTFPKRDQFAPELLYFSDCIIKNKTPEPSGQEGLIDVTIVRALYHSVETGLPVKLDNLDIKENRPNPDQEIIRPPVEQPEMVRAKSAANKR